jgi:hypothetical protein
MLAFLAKPTAAFLNNPDSFLNGLLEFKNECCIFQSNYQTILGDFSINNKDIFLDYMGKTQIVNAIM